MSLKRHHLSKDGNDTEYSSRKASCEGHEVSDITLTPSQSLRQLRAAANPLDIVQFAANPN